MDIDAIKQRCGSGAMRWTNHILVRLLQRNISLENIEHAIMNGEIIEEYPEDYPYPSCLISGLSTDKQSLHVVCGISPTELYLITAYYPSLDEWTDDFKSRKEPKK